METIQPVTISLLRTVGLRYNTLGASDHITEEAVRTCLYIGAYSLALRRLSVR